MIQFRVPDMTCGHCVQTITSAVKALDPEATLNFDLSTHQVSIDPTRLDAEALEKAISRAGYSPELI